jgi:hypothetical protein
MNKLQAMHWIDTLLGASGFGDDYTEEELALWAEDLRAAWKNGVEPRYVAKGPTK